MVIHMVQGQMQVSSVKVIYGPNSTHSTHNQYILRVKCQKMRIQLIWKGWHVWSRYFTYERGWGSSLTYNVYDMVFYANESSFSVVLDVQAISLVNVHGTSRWLMALLGRMCCPPAREGFTEQWDSFQLQCVGSEKASKSYPFSSTRKADSCHVSRRVYLF